MLFQEKTAFVSCVHRKHGIYVLFAVQTSISNYESGKVIVRRFPTCFRAPAKLFLPTAP